jgi:hypothetical protein
MDDGIAVKRVNKSDIIQESCPPKFFNLSSLTNFL